MVPKDPRVLVHTAIAAAPCENGFDDVLSELDDRRSLALDEASRHTQAILTTTDVDVVPARYLSQAHRLRIEAGEVLTEAVA